MATPENAQQQLINPEVLFTRPGPPLQVEAEHTADDDQWWQIFADIVEDILEQDVPGSIVILIVAAICAPSIFKMITAWFKRGSK